MSIEDKIKAELPRAFESSKRWCQDNLSKVMSGYENFDYDIFRYAIDTKTDPAADMYFNPKDNGLLRVNTKQIRWLMEKREMFPYEPEVDLESMFIHEIVEYMVDRNPKIMVAYLPELKFPHVLAREIENINRRARGLMEYSLMY